MKRFLFAICLLFAVPAFAATQFDFLLSQVRTSTTSLIGGKVYFYKAGTTTAKSVWLDRNQTTAAANPYTLDANGTALVYGAGTYRIVIKDATGTTKYDRDNITVVGEEGAVTPVDATSADQAIDLPTGGVATYVKTDSTAHVVTLTPVVGGQTINGFTTYTLYLGGEMIRLVLSGNTWYED